MNFHKFFSSVRSQKIINISQYVSLSFLLLSYSVFVCTSYKFGVSDHNEQIPIVLRVLDSSYLMNDWFVNQTEGLSPRFFFSQLISLFTHYLSINMVYFLLFVICSGITIFSIYFIAHTLFENNLVALFTALAFLFGPRISLGSNWITGQILVPSTLAIALITFSLYLYLTNRKQVSFFILGISTLFQPILGLLAMGVVLVNEIMMVGTRKTTEIIVDSGKYLVIYGIIAVWGFLPLYLTSSDLSNPDIFYILTYMRHPHHYCPFSFPYKDYLAFFGLLTIFLLAIYLNYIPKNPEFHHFCKICIGSILMLGIIGTIFVEIIPIPLIGKLQLFRINPFIAIFAYPYIFSLLIGTVSILIPKSLCLTSNKCHFMKPFVIVIAVILSGIILVQTDIHATETKNDELYQWIQGNTPDDAVFIIPPRMDDFRLGANRAIVVDWKAFPFKDSAIIEWKERIYDVTDNYENNFLFQGFSSYSQLDKSYALMNESDFLYLSKKYDAKYLVMTNERELGFTELYSGTRYRVYGIG